jgi:predicted O-methyltransferase YrrM
VLIDADKTNSAAYLERALRLSRPGTAIMVLKSRATTIELARGQDAATQIH